MMFAAANKKHKPELSGALHRRTTRGKKLYLNRKRLEFKKICERSEVYKKAIREWANYEPWWKKQNKDFGWWDGPMLTPEEPFILSFHDSLSIKITAIVASALILVMISVLIADVDTKAMLSEDSIVAFIFGIFILVNGTIVKFLHFVIRKPRFERARRKFKDEHPYLAQELWPEEAKGT